MEHAGEQLTSNLVHVGNHQQQARRSGVGGGERTSLQRAVDGTSGASLALHLLHGHCLTEDVLAASSGPLVNVFGHRRRRSNGIDGGYLGKHVTNVCRGLVAITGHEFLFFSHNFSYSKSTFRKIYENVKNAIKRVKVELAQNFASVSILFN
jgi:hypothetical protein